MRQKWTILLIVKGKCLYYRNTHNSRLMTPILAILFQSKGTTVSGNCYYLGTEQTNRHTDAHLPLSIKHICRTKTYLNLKFGQKWF